MASTDTVVGIVGAVLLAGIMVGVFVYEYNNPAVPGPLLPTEEGKMAAFRSVYKGLNATEDLDGDNLANYNDTDMDDNGVNDTDQDGDLVRKSSYDGSTPVPPPAPPQQFTQDFPLTLYTGNEGVSAWLNWTIVALPVPGAPAVPDLTLTLLKGSESVVSSGAGVTSGSQRTATLVAEPQVTGEYILRVTMTQASPQSVQFHVDAVVSYGPAHAAPVERPAVK